MTTTLTRRAAEPATALAKAAPKAAAKRANPTQPTAKAIFLNFRRGHHTQRTNQFLLELPGIDSRQKATSLAGRRVVWTSPGGKQISGHITGAHGNSGVLRARFSKGLPTQAIGTKADVY